MSPLVFIYQYLQKQNNSGQNDFSQKFVNYFAHNHFAILFLIRDNS